VASRGEARDRRRIGGIFLRDEERIEYTAGWTGNGSVQVRRGASDVDRHLDSALPINELVCFMTYEAINPLIQLGQRIEYGSSCALSWQ
jgi:hypothetical protein